MSEHRILNTKDVTIDKENKHRDPGLPKVRSFEQILGRADSEHHNYAPQSAPGSTSAKKEGHNVDNSIPLSIFPIALDKYCIAFCGLPGRGKTHISRRLAKYLSFFNALTVEVFNVQEYRRKLETEFRNSDFFDPYNEEAIALRTHFNNLAIADMVTFLNQQANCVAILDATNTSHQRRLNVVNMVRPTGAKIIWIEVSNDNEEFLTNNYRYCAMNSPEYKGIDTEIAEKDYRDRINNYATTFVTIDANLNHPVESKWTYFKCDHWRHHFVVHNIRGNLPLKIVQFVMNMRTSSHSFYLSRHGQSEYNAVGRIGGDSGLSPHGLAYARKLAEFADEKIAKDSNGREVPGRLWTSTMRRTRETAQFIGSNTLMLQDPDDPLLQTEWINMKPRAWHHLDELFAGACDGMTYEEIEKAFPEEFERREKDKLAYRYPRGESYLDVIARLEPIILEMERHREPLLIVAHQGILRIIYAFYMGLSRAEAPYVSVPLNCVLQLTPLAFSCEEKRYTLYVPTIELCSDGQDEKNKYALMNDPQSH